MQRLEAALPKLAKLRQLGVGLSLDNFGTGYSSLQHLPTLPVHSLKIDRGFVNEMQRRVDQTALLRAIVLLGNSVGKAVIAGGIETSAQLEQLRKMGCTAGQGYYLARPLAAERVDRMLDALVAKTRVATEEPGVDPGFMIH
jgi:EAL domain-containing protein (putative c-di-GMP-specific phosphodiesterase class I)